MTAEVFRLGVRAPRQQDAHDVAMPLAGGLEHRRLAASLAPVAVRPGPAREQLPHLRLLAAALVALHEVHHVVEPLVQPQLRANETKILRTEEKSSNLTQLTHLPRNDRCGLLKLRHDFLVARLLCHL